MYKRASNYSKDLLKLTKLDISESGKSKLIKRIGYAEEYFSAKGDPYHPFQA